MEEARRPSARRALCALVLLAGATRAQDPARDTERAPLDDADAAAIVLTAPSTPRDARREAAAALLFRLGGDGIARVEIALRAVLALPLERELVGTVEGQVLEALRDALEARAAGGVDFDPALLNLAPCFVQLVARKEGQRGAARSDSSARALLALLQTNLRLELLKGLRALIGRDVDPGLRRAALLALPRLRLVELCADVAEIAFGDEEPVILRRLAQETLVGLAQTGFATREDFVAWRTAGGAQAPSQRELAWAAGERLREELRLAREALVAHANGDLEILLDLLGDPTFPRVRAGAARALGAVVAGFAPERDAEALRRSMSALVLGIRRELHPEVLEEMAICLRNLAPLVGAADRCVQRAEKGSELQARCEQFRLHIKPLRDVLIELAPDEPAPEVELWAVRARVIEALRWFSLDPLVQTHVVELLERALDAPAELSIRGGAAYASYRRALLRTAAELDLAGPPATRALALLRRLSADASLELRRSALPLLRALGANDAVGPAVRETLLGLARSEPDAGVRAEALQALVAVAEVVPELREAAIAAHTEALAAAEVLVRRAGARWFLHALGEPLWRELASAAFTAVLAQRVPAGAEEDAEVRAMLARAIGSSLRGDWLELALAHLRDEELRVTARWLRLALDRGQVEERARRELALRLGRRLPDAAYAILAPELRADGEESPFVVSDERDRLLLRFGWEAFARLERMSSAPAQLGAAERARLEDLLRRAERRPAREDELLLRADLELRAGYAERVLRELRPLLERSAPEHRGALLERLIWANWRVERWTEVTSLAAQRESGPSSSWWVEAMVFEARIARDRAEGRASAVERVRDAQQLVSAGAPEEIGALLGVRRTLDLFRLFERQELIEEAKLLLAALQPRSPLPRELERELAAARALYR